MQKKILIPGGKTSDWDLVNAAHRLGMYVITSGTDSHAMAHKYSDEYICVDYSDKEAMLNLARDLKVDYMCSSANDIALVTTAYVCEKLGLPGHDSYETTLTIHHKDQFKDVAKRLQLHVPDGEWFEDEESAIAYALQKDYKLIIKPVDLVGGNGISTAETAEGKIDAIRKAFNMSLCKRIVIEEFISGTAHSISAFIVDGKVASWFSDNQFSYAGQFWMTTSSCPAENVELVSDKVIRDLEKLAQKLHLVDGRLTPQYIMDEKGNPYILEITRRTSGDLYSWQVSKAMGYDPIDWILKAECGMDCSDYPKNVKQTGYNGRHCIVATRNGIIKNIRIMPELEKYIYNRLEWWEPGYEIKNFQKESAGILLYAFEKKEQMKDIVSRIPELIRFEFAE